LSILGLEILKPPIGKKIKILGVWGPVYFHPLISFIFLRVLICFYFSSRLCQRATYHTGAFFGHNFLKNLYSILVHATMLVEELGLCPMAISSSKRPAMPKIRKSHNQRVVKSESFDENDIISYSTQIKEDHTHQAN